VSKTATPTVVLAGQVVTYVVTVTNTGPSTANNVVITDVLQGNDIFVAAWWRRAAASPTADD
jgi:uncharacterized repeat protein (TIGR01451 family)